MKLKMIKAGDNKILIILSILIVIGISVSLAYFLATSLINGEGTSASVTTAVIHGATLTMEGKLNFDDKDILPGHKNVSVLKLTATGNNEMIPYNLIWTGTNSLGTPLNYIVYKSTNEISTGKTCNQATGKVNGVNIISEECTITNEASMGSPIATGIISTSTTETKVMLVENEMITATLTGEVLYYYVVLEYPDTGEDQSNDMGGSFSGIVSVEEGNGNIADINLASINIKEKNASNYTEIDTIPAKDSKYVFNSTKSSCTNSATPSWNEETWDVTVNNLSSIGTSCNLYFDEQAGTPASEIIADAGTATDDSMFSDIVGDGVYVWTKGDYSGGEQEIKYYRGNVNNNWVIFGRDGNKYIWWRIIRNNSNGSLRMIYAGLSSSKKTSPATTGEETQIGTKEFNSASNNNMYAGFKYTEYRVHGLSTNSTILGTKNSTDKTTLYGWYNATLGANINYSEKIDLEAGFCNDRQPSSQSSSIDGKGGTGTTTTYYAPYIRLINRMPSLLCINDLDIFKTPVGLITTDELSMGGIIYGTASYGPKNTSSYLYTNSIYWTMSPSHYDSNVNAWYVHPSGFVSYNWIRAENGVRPVINIKSDTLFEEGGDGTSTNPYFVIGS